MPILLSSCQFFDRHVVIEDNTLYQKQDNKPLVENVKGKALFNRDCSMCHQKGKRGIDFIRNLEDRMTKTYFVLYITKHDSLVRAKDVYALKMQETFNNAGVRHDHVYSNEELENLIEYAFVAFKN